MKKILSSIILSIGIGLAGYFFRDNTIEEKIEINSEPIYKVERIVDGDTIILKDGLDIKLKKIRCLGINTPEKKDYFYNEAKSELEKLVSGKEIRLEIDNEDIDNFGRALRYVFVNNENINIRMVREGYARVFMCNDLRYEQEFLKAEEEAKREKRGIWK